MSDVPTPPVPRPYKVTVHVKPTHQSITRSVWAYDVQEAVIQSLVEIAHESGIAVAEMEPVSVTPDDSVWIASVRGGGG